MAGLHQRTILITGANRGIGLAIATGLAAMPHIKVLLASRDPANGQTAAGSTSGNVIPVVLDLSDRNILRQQIQAIQDAQGTIDSLVNNAGVLEEGSVLEVEDGAFCRCMRVNFEAPYDLIRLLTPGMIKRGYGRIVNVSSGWGSFSEGLTGPAAYSISKAALNALTLSTSHALPHSVKINAMCPGWVKTRMGGSQAERLPEQGADTAIWLATLPDDGPTGGFFRDRQPIAW